MKSLEKITQINDYLARYQKFVEFEDQSGRYNINTRSENFFIPILQELFDCPNLNNLNLENSNFPGLDLGDEIKRIAFQVSSNRTSKKIINTLKVFKNHSGQLYKKFDKLMFFFIQPKQSQYKSERIFTLVREIKMKNPNFSFNPKEDILDFADISRLINYLESKQISHLLDILRFEIDGDDISPLSKVPRTSRSFSDIEIIGRDDILKKISISQNDLLLIGPPGIGKTFILKKIATEKHAFFVEDNDSFDLTKAIDITKPEFLFIDDAYRNPSILSKLINIRELKGLSYKIIATSWPISKKSKVITEGRFFADQIIELDLFTKDELAQLLRTIIRDKKLRRQYYWEQLIIDFSNGLPGLAVLFLENCIETGGKEVYEGSAIMNFLTAISLETRSEIQWEKTKQALAFISLFGTRGLLLSNVCEILDSPMSELEALLSSYEYSGILKKSWSGIHVRPRLIRAALIKEAYFTGNRNISNCILDYVDQNVCNDDLLNTLLDVVRINGSVPKEIIKDKVRKSSSAKIIEEYLLLFPEEIKEHIKQNGPSPETIYPGLVHEPEFVLPFIFHYSESDCRPLHSNPDHVLRKLESWINNNPNALETIDKRKLVLDKLKEYSKADGDCGVLAKVLNILLSPKFEQTHLAPGGGNTVEWGTGLYPIDTLKKISDLWDQSRPLIKILDIVYFPELIHGLMDWVYPSRVVSSVEEKYDKAIRCIALPFFNDLGALSISHPAILRQLKSLPLEIDQRNLVTNISENFSSAFDVLFPDNIEYLRNIDDLSYKSNVACLASNFSKMEFRDVIEIIRWVKCESDLLPNKFPDFTPFLFSIIAENVGDPLIWCKELMDNDLDEYIVTFLNRINVEDSKSYIPLVENLLEKKNTRRIAIEFLITTDGVDACLLNRIQDKIETTDVELIKYLCQCREVHLLALKELLNHKIDGISLAAAIGEWKNNPKGNVRDEILKDWEKVIRETTICDFDLKDIFEDRKDYIVDWFARVYINKNRYIPQSKEHDLIEILSIMDNEEKEKIIDLFLADNKERSSDLRIISKIIENDTSLYEYLVKKSDSEEQLQFILAPVALTPISEIWCEMVLMAINKGVSIKEISDSIVGFETSRAHIGPASSYFKDIVISFEGLLNNQNQKINELVRLVIEKANEEYEKYFAIEREREVYGRE